MWAHTVRISDTDNVEGREEVTSLVGLTEETRGSSETTLLYLLAGLVFHLRWTGASLLLQRILLPAMVY